jgi:hypothetical protein
MRLAPLACALLVVAGCARTPRVNVDPETGNVDVDVQRTGSGETWTGNLRGTGNAPTVSGTATVRVSDDMTHASVSLMGAMSGAAYPWHVHEGSCGDNGPVVGNAAAYPLLRPGTDGRASAEAHLSNLELNEAKNYYVNVHASASDLGTIVACGPIDD